jgi:molecular chaperone GrpE (heat shock protein)
VDTLAAQGGALVGGCLKVGGLFDDALLADVLDGTLRRGAVTVFDPTRRPMDPARHRVHHTVAGADRVIARTLIPGYLDDGRILRPAEVVVYKWGRS